MTEWKTCTAGHSWSSLQHTSPNCPACGADAVDRATVDEAPATVITPPAADTDPSATVAPSGDPPTQTYLHDGMPPDASGDSEPRFNLPGYETMKQLGRGGMGIVYLARDETLQRRVAIKVIRTGPWSTRDERQRFVREARLAAQLKHPGIVAVHAVGEQDGCPYMVMEFVEGGSLDERRKLWPMPPDDAARFVEKLARAVALAHDKGITHRDLKPANVLLAPDGAPMITDFGLASAAEGEAGLTVSGAVMGTPAYMAPEQAMGKTKEIGPPADIHALGAILYELLTRKTPFSGASIMEVLEQVRDRPAPPPRRHVPGIPPALEAICLCCLEKNPADRYPTAAALADDLARYLVGERPRAYKGFRLPRWALRATVGVVAAVMVIALGIGMGWHRALAALFTKKDPPVIEQVWVRADTDARKKQATRAMGILYQHCAECHGATSKAGKHDVRDIRALTAESGKKGRYYVVPGDLKASHLWAVIEDGSMPPEEEMPASAKDTIRKWIEDGAPGWYEAARKE